jgi:hypothetical protein
MKVLYDAQVLRNPLDVLRRAGYSAFVDPVTKEESFVFRTTTEYYPRFHVYVAHRGDDVEVSLHLDQRKPSYGQSHAHCAEYDGAIVEHEMRRIDGWVGKVMREM